MANFLGLPLEVRDQIYKLSLIVGVEIVAHPDYFEKPTVFGEGEVSRPAVALLRVNKQIYEEAAAVFYGKNNWRIPNVSRPSVDDEIYYKYGHLFRQVTVHLDRRDIDEYLTTKELKDFHRDFAPSTMDQRLVLFHTSRRDYLSGSIETRQFLLGGFMKHIQSFTLVVGNLYCSSGCCRLEIIENDVCNFFLRDLLPAPETGDSAAACPHLKEVRVIGLKTHEERELVYGKGGALEAAVKHGKA